MLFVIAMCTMASKQPLALTWWPLARDCTYYSVSLAVLALFFGGIAEPLLVVNSIMISVKVALEERYKRV